MSAAVQLPPLAHLSSSNVDVRRPQASPLPMKNGEIGFVEGVHGVTNKHEDESAETSSSLPPRHPADRDYRRSFSQSLRSVNETRSNSFFFARLKPKKVPSVGGLQLTTILLFAIQLISLGGTIALWVFATHKVKPSLDHELSVGSLAIFIHVVFVIFVLGQLVFLERRIYRLRSERSFRPGGVLPQHRWSLSSAPDSIVAAAPWNRPTLPTYGAVLTQSGVATGDVEDNLIAIPPPPAYGNVRGSTLLDSAR